MESRPTPRPEQRQLRKAALRFVMNNGSYGKPPNARPNSGGYGKPPYASS